MTRLNIDTDYLTETLENSCHFFLRYTDAGVFHGDFEGKEGDIIRNKIRFADRQGDRTLLGKFNSIG